MMTQTKLRSTCLPFFDFACVETPSPSRYFSDLELWESCLVWYNRKEHFYTMLCYAHNTRTPTLMYQTYMYKQQGKITLTVLKKHL
jgi:hypothetical protein